MTVPRKGSISSCNTVTKYTGLVIQIPVQIPGPPLSCIHVSSYWKFINFSFLPWKKMNTVLSVLERCRKKWNKKMHVIYCPFCQLKKQNKTKLTFILLPGRLTCDQVTQALSWLQGGVSLAVLTPHPTQGVSPFPFRAILLLSRV